MSLCNQARGLLRALVFGALLLFLCGCETLFGDEGFFPDASNDYLDATIDPALRLPDGKVASPSDDAYPIPELKYAKVLPESYEVPRVTRLDEVEGRGSVRIQRFQDDEWILTKRSPSQTWPLLLGFLQSNQIPLLRADAQAGVIKTDLLVVNRDKTAVVSSLDKVAAKEAAKARSQAAGFVDLPKESYEFVLKAGVQKNSTEIWVTHEAAAADDVVTDSQDITEISAERRANMVALLAKHLAGSPEQSSHSLLAQGLGSASKVRLQYGDSGEPELWLVLPFNRGWASLSLALKKASFVVADIDRSKGVYFANYVDPSSKGEKPGFFAGLLGAKNNEQTASSEQASLLITVIEGEDALRIKVQNRQPPLLEANEQAFLLRKILNKLS
jgi:outer membrane protein assembly factor BamC